MIQLLYKSPLEMASFLVSPVYIKFWVSMNYRTAKQWATL